MSEPRWLDAAQQRDWRAYVDGSVRLISNGINNSTWVDALLPNDGLPLGSDG